MFKLMPDDLIEELREIAREGERDTFPHLTPEDFTENDAADFIASAVHLLRELAKAGGPIGMRAERILMRLE